ncbi:MAG: NUDIX hydrolase [Bacteroidota bacterium]|nr:NUDIX hydrolase [Bacteroidota bacterium]
MYKFFINDKPLLIASDVSIELASLQLPIKQYNKETKLMDLVRKIEENSEKGLILLYKDPDFLFQKLLSKFTCIHAGGGIVFNDKKELLLMKRLGKWDLPKGKIDPGETNEEGAVREVEEECGISPLNIQYFMGNSYHTYKLQGHRFCKLTHWYVMNTPFTGELVPQIEESITEVKWANPAEIDLRTLDTYESIRAILQDVLHP